jgi:hypothetical protein
MNDDPLLDHASELWRSQPVNLPVELEKGMRKHQRRARARVIVAIGFTLMVCGLAIPFAEIITNARTFLERFSMLLMFSGTGYLLSQLHDLMFQLAKEKSASDLSRASVEHYRKELSRLRDFSSGRIFWTRYLMLIPAYLLFFTSTALSHEGKLSLWYNPGLPILIALSAIPLNLLGAHKAQKRIDALTSALNDTA